MVTSLPRVIAAVLAVYAGGGLILGAAVLEQLVMAVIALVFAVLSLTPDGARRG